MTTTINGRPLDVFCVVCNQAKGDGCRDVTRRDGKFGFAPLYPVGVFHGRRITDADKVAAYRAEKVKP